jgi:hypothetical protein
MSDLRGRYALECARGLLVATLLLFASQGHGDDAWFLRMNANGSSTDARGCTQAHWSDDIVFFNTGVSDARVTFLDASYPLGAQSLTVLGGRSTTLHEAFGVADDPTLERRLGVLHAEVPREVVVMSRMLLFAAATSPTPPECPVQLPPYYGPAALSTTALPVRRSLAPANQRQVHLAADLAGIESRVSVVIYNASDVVASAVIEIHRGCDDSIVEQRQIIVPSRSTAQVLGFTTADDHVCPQGSAAALRRTIVVTADQPSLTWVTATQQFTSGGPILGASIVY